MILTVGGVKGGCGKSTVSIGLCIRRAQDARVLLVDADTQCTSSDFTLLRNETTGDAGYTCVQLTGTAVRNEILPSSSGVEGTQRAAISVSDLLIIPVVPRAFDVWTLESFAKLVDEMRPTNPRLIVWTFLNRKEHSGPDNDEAIAILEADDTLDYKAVALGDRKVYGRAAAVGLGVEEYRPRNAKAIEELEQLYRAVYDIK